MRFFFHLEALKCLWVNWLSTWTVVVFIGNANQGHRCIVTHGSSRCVSKTLSIKTYSILICHDHNCIFLVYFLISTEGTLRRPIICANSVVRLKSVLRALVMGCGATHHCRQHHFRFEIIWKGPWCSFSFLLETFFGASSTTAIMSYEHEHQCTTDKNDLAIMMLITFLTTTTMII